MIYKALVVDEIDGKFHQSVCSLNSDNLPLGEVLIRVNYSSLNYKDALSATGNKGITKKYPHTPGIDSAGEVVESCAEDFRVGDKVIVMGHDLGMNTAGGYGQYIRVPAEWVVKLPETLSMQEAMIIGTAGFTAGISLFRLSQLVKPEDGKIIVSGATGGVGSVAVSLLSKLGYQVCAITGKSADHEFLKSLGASEIISREDFLAIPDKPILSAQYAGGIDTVGGDILVKMIKSTNLLGAVTTCGSVSSVKMENMTVFPFILRGISLIGISAQNYPSGPRRDLWKLMAKDWKPDHLMNLYQEIGLEDLPARFTDILNGKIKGRVLVNLNL